MAVILFTLFPILLSLLFIYYCTRKYTYWHKKKVLHLKPRLLFGNYGDYILQKKYIGDVVKDICDQFPNEPYIGTYFGTEPALLIKDLELLKRVFTKDFYYFNGREVSDYTHKETLTKGTFFTYGDNWKVLRQNLTPLFSSAKMKNMFTLIRNCAKTLENLLEHEAVSCKTIEVRSLMARFTMDSIGSCALGVETNVMGKSDGNPFKEVGNSIFESTTGRGFKWVARLAWPSIFYALGFQTFPEKITRFFETLIVNGYENRRKETNTSVQSFADLVFSFKDNKYIVGDSIENSIKGETKKISLEANNELLSAVCAGIFAAGFETSAGTLSFTLYELAKYPEVQDKAIEDVDRYLRKNSNKIEYECINQLPYVDACIDETLRLYPVLGMITREVYEDYTFPSGLKVEKGMRIQIPAYYLHKNPDYFPDPEEYRPERFYQDEKKNIKPYSYIPFGEGPRICIGMRFAKMQITAGLITVLKKYRVTLADGMSRNLTFEPRAIVTQPIGGIKLKFIRREDTICNKFE